MNNKNVKILIVDDEQDLREILEFNLTSEGFEVDVASSAEEALNLNLKQYNLILLDVMMGEISGYKMADIIRKKYKLSLPIIFLTARTEENDLLTGFNVGGDDYINKPFSIKEITARIKAIIRRTSSQETKLNTQTKILYKDLEVNLESKIITINTEQIKLTRKEFDILIILLNNKDKFISRQEILDQIWSDNVIVTDRNVDVNIARLRKKIGIYGQQIIGRTGYGYSFRS